MEFPMQYNKLFSFIVQNLKGLCGVTIMWWNSVNSELNFINSLKLSGMYWLNQTQTQMILLLAQAKQEM